MKEHWTRNQKTCVLSIIIPLTSVIQLKIQSLAVAATQMKLNSMNCGNPILPQNYCSSPEVYILMVSCVPSSLYTCQVFVLKLTWTWNYIPTPVSTSTSCPASICRSPNEMWVVEQLPEVWVFQAPSLFSQPYSCPGLHNSRGNAVLGKAVQLHSNYAYICIPKSIQELGWVDGAGASHLTGSILRRCL